MVLKRKDGVYEPGKRPKSVIKAKKVDFADCVIIGFEAPTVEYYGKEIESWPYWIRKSDDMRVQGIFYGNEDYYAATKPHFNKWFSSRIKIGAYADDGTMIEIGTIHSGISDDMKKDMSENPDNYLFKPCAIQMMEVDKKEKTIRHGFFKFMREDLLAEDCTLSKIFGQSK